RAVLQDRAGRAGTRHIAAARRDRTSTRAGRTSVMKPARRAVLHPTAKPAVAPSNGRLSVERHLGEDYRAQLAQDGRRGLTARPKRLPPKYFYDDRGSRLFEAICELPEYYPTRTEHALLADIADAVIAAARPRQLVELGSGASRKTRLLLDVLTRVEP